MPQSNKPTVPATVNDFSILTLRLPRQPSYTKETTHYVYLRANAPKVPSEDTPREVFLVNLPIDATESHVRSLFADQLGGARIENVAFDGVRVGKGITAPVAPAKKSRKRKRVEVEAGEMREEVGLLPEVWDREMHRGGGTAVVTFVDQASAQLALKEAWRAVKIGREVVWGKGVESREPPLGSARYLSHQRLKYPDHAVLQQSVDAYMAAFAATEGARAQTLARQRSVPDEDGFVTVTRGGRSGPAREEEAKAKEEELRKRQQSMVKEGFYRFQVREKKKEQAKDLVKAFEADRKRVEEMRGRKGKIRPE